MSLFPRSSAFSRKVDIPEFQKEATEYVDQLRKEGRDHSDPDNGMVMVPLSQLEGWYNVLDDMAGFRTADQADDWVTELRDEVYSFLRG